MLNKQAVERLSQVNLTGEGILGIFKSLAEVLEAQPAEQIAWTLGYVQDTELLVGELVPTINFVLTRHNPQEFKEDDERLS